MTSPELPRASISNGTLMFCAGSESVEICQDQENVLLKGMEEVPLWRARTTGKGYTGL